MDSITISFIMAVLAILGGTYWWLRNPRAVSSTKDDVEATKSRSEATSKTKKKRRPRKKIPKVPRSEMSEGDIENLLSKSLVPFTRKQMKADGLKPYTIEAKVKKLAELDAMSKTSGITKFSAKLYQTGFKLNRVPATTFQVNIGLHCNQACNHCHVDSSPLRKEMMTRDVSTKCIEIIKNSPTITCVDITGGAPELNKDFRYWVTECRKIRGGSLQIIDRCNLTVLLEPTQLDLAAFLAEHDVHIIASLPCYLEDNVDKQRGDQVFLRSIRGLQKLNKLGYGRGESDDPSDKRRLQLDLVYNPTGYSLPPAREKLEGAYKKQLKEKYDIVFDQLHCITNMPINRYYDHLKQESKLESYMNTLVQGFNPSTCEGLMCRSYITVRWDGQIFDCDFNQQVELYPIANAFKRKRQKQKEDTDTKSSVKLNSAVTKGISVFDIDCTDDMLTVPVATALHCYGCTAGNGSS